MIEMQLHQPQVMMLNIDEYLQRACDDRAHGGRDYHDDRVPSTQLEELVNAEKNISPAFRTRHRGIASQFSGQQRPEFYEGYLACASHIGVLLQSLIALDPVLQQLLGPLNNTLLLNALPAARLALEARQQQATKEA